MYSLASQEKLFVHKKIKMETKIPKPSEAFLSIVRADFTTQWRNRRAVIMSLFVPVIILFFWKGLVAVFGGTFVLSISLTIGLTSIGLMGFATSVARDRDKGIFQRLRVTPVPTFFIMLSRLMVQLVMIILLTTFVFIVGHNYDKITISPAGYALTFITAFIGGALYLGLGQMIVGLVKSAETVNSTTRLVYIAFITLGMFGEFSPSLNEELKMIIHWSPFGTVKTILGGSMEPSSWSNQTSIALLVTIAYAVIFSFLGIKWFKWNSAGA
jgi:ABC-2 type transport system permease protein